MATHSENNPIYNVIGKTYDTTRKADPFITQKLIELLNTTPSKKYLDIGCGSGNYTGMLNQQGGLKIEGVDVSSEMLKKARLKYPHIHWHEGDARQLPFPSDHYDGAICVLATHHIKDLPVAFKEIFRVLSQGRFVIFTATSEQCHHYWLREYFPKMIADASTLMSSFDHLHTTLSHAGFKNIGIEPFFISSELEDLFLHSGKHRPEIYLNPAVREGISSFHLSSFDDEIEQGVDKLRQDMDSGRINEVIQSYENTLGDYSFVFAEKI